MLSTDQTFMIFKKSQKYFFMWSDTKFFKNSNLFQAWMSLLLDYNTGLSTQSGL